MYNPNSNHNRLYAPDDAYTPLGFSISAAPSPTDGDGKRIRRFPISAAPTQTAAWSAPPPMTLLSTRRIGDRISANLSISARRPPLRVRPRR